MSWNSLGIKFRPYFCKPAQNISQTSSRTRPYRHGQSALRLLRQLPVARQAVLEFFSRFRAFICTKQRQVFNISLPLGVKYVPTSEVCPPTGELRGMSTPSFTPRGEHYVLFSRIEGQTEVLYH
jgi:hypothetical protein